MVSRPSDSAAAIPRIRLVMLPKDTNSLGNIFGGVLLSNIDLAAGEHARRISPHRYVTKVLREVEFIAPVLVGDTVSFFTETVRIGTTSVTVKVLVTAERGIGRLEECKVTEAEVVMVAINERGRPIPIFDKGSGAARTTGRKKGKPAAAKRKAGKRVK